jgi:hypothetical protein
LSVRQLPLRNPFSSSCERLWQSSPLADCFCLAVRASASTSSDARM